MDIDTFWKLIDKSRRGTEGDCDLLVENLTNLLRQLDLAEIVSFKEQLDQRLNEAYRWDLWAVAYIINGGCSDDGFDYFCGWLIAQGRKRFEQALASPESAARGAEPDECNCESILYAAAEAYEAESGGSDIPSLGSRPPEPAGTPWQEEELAQLYPKLWKRFS